jgi:hypothetical protein
LDQLVGSSVEVEELVHLFDRGHSPKGRQGNVTSDLLRALETGAATQEQQDVDEKIKGKA